VARIAAVFEIHLGEETCPESNEEPTAGPPARKPFEQAFRLFPDQEQALPGGAGGRRARSQFAYGPQAEEARLTALWDRARISAALCSSTASCAAR